MWFGWQHLQCMQYSIELMCSRRARDTRQQRGNENPQNRYWVIETFCCSISPYSFYTLNRTRLECEDFHQNERWMQNEWNTKRPADRVCNGFASESSTLNRSCWFVFLVYFWHTSFALSRTIYRCVAQRQYVPNNGYTRTELVKLFSFRKIHDTESNWWPHNCTEHTNNAAAFMSHFLFTVTAALIAFWRLSVCAFAGGVLVFRLSLEQSAVPLLFLHDACACSDVLMYSHSVVGIAFHSILRSAADFIMAWAAKRSLQQPNRRFYEIWHLMKSSSLL